MKLSVQSTPRRSRSITAWFGVLRPSSTREVFVCATTVPALSSETRSGSPHAVVVVLGSAKLSLLAPLLRGTAVAASSSFVAPPAPSSSAATLGEETLGSTRTSTAPVASDVYGRLATLAVHVIVSAGQCHSAGDALRELNELQLIKSDFVLIPGDVVANFELAPIIAAHKARRELDRAAVHLVPPGDFAYDAATLTPSAGGKVSKARKVSSGKPPSSHLRSTGVSLLDTGFEVFLWVGRAAPVELKSSAFNFAQRYLKDYKRPPVLPITRHNEGREPSGWIDEHFSEPVKDGCSCACVVS